MNKERITQKELESFLSELTALCDKYNLYIGGCGCCGSPWIMREGAPNEATELRMNSNGKYVADFFEEVYNERRSSN